jgi:hypothetical protein
MLPYLYRKPTKASSSETFTENDENRNRIRQRKRGLALEEVKRDTDQMVYSVERTCNVRTYMLGIDKPPRYVSRSGGRPRNGQRLPPTSGSRPEDSNKDSLD